MGNKKIIGKFAKCVAIIHAQNVSQEKFEVYNAEWIIGQANNIKDIKYKKDIVTALQVMSQIEVHNAPPRKNGFMAWDIIQSDWQKDYQSGLTGNSAWDIASIINVANDSTFSEIFLESYLRHGGEKPSLAELYANLYYVKVFEAVQNNNFENIMKITQNIIDDTMFDTDIISYETLLTLNIGVYHA